MTISDIMTASVVSCRPETPVSQIARLMCDNDCGAIPVVDALGRPEGIVTDRDLACRVVAEGKDALKTEAREIMSRPIVSVSREISLDACCSVLEKNQIRRVLVVDATGSTCGIVSQADVARHASKNDTADVVRAISKSAVSRQLGARA
jgi:CBS domain-containing protein